MDHQQQAPSLPPRPAQQSEYSYGHDPAQQYGALPTQLSVQQPEYAYGYDPTQQYGAPPKRASYDQGVDSPIHYTRDPRKLVAYLVPFPKPQIHNLPADRLPPRFLIYTPPPPPLKKPAEGEKEAKIHKVQRKWEEEIREAKNSTAKTASWKGIKSKVTKGIDWGMSQTKTSNLEFLNRIGGQDETPDKHAEDGHVEGNETKKTVGLEEMVLVYPVSMPGSSDDIRKEFVNTMMRSKSKAQRDAIIATGLLPVSAAIDLMATLVWPFGGLLEIDAVWAFASIRGAKTSRNVTKRLSSTSTTGKPDEDKLHLNFTPSPRLQVLGNYLAARCHERDPKLFPGGITAPTETEVLEAIGWSPSEKGGEERNWEDEQWEITEVKDDLKAVMKKGANEWDKWCKAFEKNPEKTIKK